MTEKRSFRDPATGVLKAWGFIIQNVPGDLAQPESEDFALEPGKWRWNGTAWVPFTAPPPPSSALAQALDAAIGATPSIDPRIKAVFVEWRKQVV